MTWEYKVVGIGEPSPHRTNNISEGIQQILDNKTSEGWEYVGPVTQVYSDDRNRNFDVHSHTTLVFRREPKNKTSD